MVKSINEAYGEFLVEFRWDWFVTLTFAWDVKTFTARNRAKAWLRQLEKSSGQPIFWFLADEYGERLGRFHIHMLIGNVSHLLRFAWMKRWEQGNGIARIFAYDSKLGATYYVAKYVTKQHGDYEFSDNVDAFRVNQPTLQLPAPTGRFNCGPTVETNCESKERRLYRDSRLNSRCNSRFCSRTDSRSNTQLPISDFRVPLLDKESIGIKKLIDEFTERRTR